MDKIVKETTAKGLLIATTIGLTYLVAKKIGTMLRRSVMVHNVTKNVQLYYKVNDIFTALDKYADTGVFAYPEKDEKPRPFGIHPSHLQP